MGDFSAATFPADIALPQRFRRLVSLHLDFNCTLVSTWMLPARRRASEMETISTLARSVPAALATAALYWSCLAVSKSALISGKVTTIVTKCLVSAGAFGAKTVVATRGVSSKSVTTGATALSSVLVRYPFQSLLPSAVNAVCAC